jgi:hypothetical protein
MTIAGSNAHIVGTRSPTIVPPLGIQLLPHYENVVHISIFKSQMM